MKSGREEMNEKEKFEKNDEIYAKQCAIERCKEELVKLKVESTFNGYCSWISNMMGDFWQYFLYDIIISERCERKKKENIRVYYDGEEVVNVRTENDLGWFEGKNCEYRYLHTAATKNENKAFLMFVKKQLNGLDLLHRFNMKIDGGELILEDFCLNLQRELLYNEKLRNLFKMRNYNGELSDGLSMYKSYELYSRIESVFSGISSENEWENIEYTYAVEQLLGVNLAFCYSGYYSAILKKAKGNILRSQLENLLFGILDEFIGMKNIFSRTQIVKEYMEPVLFWDGNLKKKLTHVGAELEILRKKYDEMWDEMQTILDDEKVDLYSVRIDKKFIIDNEKPILLSESCCLTNIIENDFAKISKYIIQKINIIS